MPDKLSIMKLNKLCKDHGWEVVFSPMSIIGQNESNDRSVEIKREGHFLGKANLRLIDPSKADQLATIKDLVSLYLEPKLYQQFLRTQEQTKLHDISTAYNLQDVSIEDADLLEEKILNYVFQFNDDTHYTSRRFADDIHDLKSNWAFIDQSTMKISNVNELIKLGPITWYIPEPTEQDIEIVQQYLNRKGEISEWATMILGRTNKPLEFDCQQVELRNFPMQPGLRKDVIRLLIGVS